MFISLDLAFAFAHDLPSDQTVVGLPTMPLALPRTYLVILCGMSDALPVSIV